MLLRSHDAWHSDLSSSYITEQCSDMEKDNKNISCVPEYHRKMLRNQYKVTL